MPDPQRRRSAAVRTGDGELIVIGIGPPHSPK